MDPGSTLYPRSTLDPRPILDAGSRLDPGFPLHPGSCMSWVHPGPWIRRRLDGPALHRLLQQFSSQPPRELQGFVQRGVADHQEVTQPVGEAIRHTPAGGGGAG